MILPDYKGGSIVNLMSSISEAYGKKTSYQALDLLKTEDLAKSKNIVLIVLDGLGYHYLIKKGQNTILKKYLKGKITSVFPATTASAITTFTTGEAPKQHTITGWFMHLKEIGMVTAILPFTSMAGDIPLSSFQVFLEDIIDIKGFSERIDTNCFTVTKQEFTNSDFTRIINLKSRILGYNNLNGFFLQIKKAIKSSKSRKYIYSYWPMFDSICHMYGVRSINAERHFEEIDLKLKQFIKSIKDTSSTLLITSDHGFIDTNVKSVIWLEDHPKLKECLTLPLCGDTRVVYCYVHPSKTYEFENYVKNKMNQYCYYYKSTDLANNGFFGLYDENPKLRDRIGDYTLIMKKNYIFRDNLLNQDRRFFIGNHGGVSKKEMFVPLVIIKT